MILLRQSEDGNCSTTRWLVLVPTDLPAAPEKLRKLLSWKCKVERVSRCGCRRAGMSCSAMCSHCMGLGCTNSPLANSWCWRWWLRDVLLRNLILLGVSQIVALELCMMHTISLCHHFSYRVEWRDWLVSMVNFSWVMMQWELLSPKYRDMRHYKTKTRNLIHLKRCLISSWYNTCQ